MKKTDTVIGFHAIEALLNARPKDIVRIRYIDSKNDRLKKILQLAAHHQVTCEPIKNLPLEFKAVSHQGIIADCVEGQAWSEEDLFALAENQKSLLLLILDEVQDPHNLGACLRSANAFGAHAVVAPKDHSAKLTDVVRKVASGAAELTPFITVTNLARTIKKLQSLGVWFVGLTKDATLSLREIDLKDNIAVIMGNEAHGLRRLTSEACDFLVTIPMQGQVESLNVSVATGIALYEVRRQRS